MTAHKIILTGANGFLGRAFQELIKKDSQSTGLYLSHQSQPEFNIGTLFQSLGWQELENVIRDFAPTALVHLAWAKVRREDRNDPFHILQNSEVSCRLFDFIAKSFPSCRIIAIGSQAEVGIQTQAHNPQSLGQPANLYGQGKAKTGQYLLSQYPRVGAWIRLLTLYGPQDHNEKFIPHLLTCIKEKKDAEMSPGEQVWDFLHVQDAAEALLKAAKTPNFHGLHVLASGHQAKLKDVAEKIFSNALQYSKLPQLKVGARPYSQNELMLLTGDSRTFVESTGWTPKISLEEGLKSLVQHCLGHIEPNTYLV